MVKEGGKLAGAAGTDNVRPKIWKNLLSGKQSLPTVCCPSCGVQIPEFRIHSHLDTCLSTLSRSLEGGPACNQIAMNDFACQEASLFGERSDGRDNVSSGKGSGEGGAREEKKRGKKRGRKRKPAKPLGTIESFEGNAIESAEEIQCEKEGGQSSDQEFQKVVGVGEDREKSRRPKLKSCKKQLHSSVVEEMKEDSFSVPSEGPFCAEWQYSMAAMNNLYKSRQGLSLSEDTKQELRMSGLICIDETHNVGAMVARLDRLLSDFSASETRRDGGFGSKLKSAGALHQDYATRQEQAQGTEEPFKPVTNPCASCMIYDGSSDGGDEDLEEWWGRWVEAEWPEGPLPTGIRGGFPHISKVGLEFPKEVDLSGKSLTFPLEDNTLIPTSSVATSNISEHQGEKYCDGRGACAPEQWTEGFAKGTDERRAGPVSGVISGMVMVDECNEAVESKYAKTASEACKEDWASIERMFDLGDAGQHDNDNPSSAIQTGQHIASGMQECPVCGLPFELSTSNRSINLHIDECLAQVADFLD